MHCRRSQHPKKCLNYFAPGLMDITAFIEFIHALVKCKYFLHLHARCICVQRYLAVFFRFNAYLIPTKVIGSKENTSLASNCSLDFSLFSSKAFGRFFVLNMICEAPEVSLNRNMILVNLHLLFLDKK